MNTQNIGRDSFINEFNRLFNNDIKLKNLQKFCVKKQKWNQSSITIEEINKILNGNNPMIIKEELDALCKKLSDKIGDNRKKVINNSTDKYLKIDFTLGMYRDDADLVNLAYYEDIDAFTNLRTIEELESFIKENIKFYYKYLDKLLD